MVLVEKFEANCRYILNVEIYSLISSLEHKVNWTRGVFFLHLWSQRWLTLIKLIEESEDLVNPFGVIADVVVEPLTAEVHILVSPQRSH